MADAYSSVSVTRFSFNPLRPRGAGDAEFEREWAVAIEFQSAPAPGGRRCHEGDDAHLHIPPVSIRSGPGGPEMRRWDWRK